MIGEVAFAVIGLLFLIADIRTFSSTFQQTFFGQSNTTLAIMATSVFATAFLAPLVGWRLGPRAGVAISAALPAIFLVAETGATNGAQIAVAAELGLGPEPPRATQLGMVFSGLGLAAGSPPPPRGKPPGGLFAGGGVSGGGRPLF